MPATHGVQLAEAAFADAEPAAQGVAAVEPTPQAVPAGQSKQLDAADCSVRLPNEPSSHSATDAEPIGQKPPAVQLSHAVAPLEPW